MLVVYRDSILHAAAVTEGDTKVKLLLRHAIMFAEGSIPAAAERLDVSRKTVYRYLEKYPELLRLATRLRAEKVLKGTE
jgi:transcriptional regulator of acetoin/glycerol metabolism